MYSTTSKILSIYVIKLLVILILKCSAEEACETIPTEIHLTKGNFRNNLQLLLSC